MALLGDLQADAAEEGVKEEEGGCQAPGLEDVGKVESKVQDKALAPALARSVLEFPSGVSRGIQAQDPCQR